MAAIAKEQRREIELAIYEHRIDGGVVAVRNWLYDRLKEHNREWPRLDGAELHRLQGAALEVAKLIRLIEQGPTIREGATHG